MTLRVGGRGRSAIVAGGFAATVTLACQPSDPTTELQDILSGTRIVEPRRSAALDHRPCNTGPQAPLSSCMDSLALQRESALTDLVREVEAATGPNGPAEGLSVLALVDALIADGDRAALDRAVSRLRIAVDLDPANPDLRNDLAVVLLVRGASIQDPWDTAEALDQAERALGADPDHAAARFNRALALERLGLVNMAVDAWRQVAGRDAVDGWREEAATRATWIERTMAAVPDDRPRVDRVLRRAARLLDPATGAPMEEGAWDAVRGDAQRLADLGEAGALAILDELVTPSGAERETGQAAAISTALTRYVEAMDLWGDGKFAESQQAYRSAEAAADGPGAGARALRWRAQVGATRHDVYAQRYHEAERRLAPVLDASQAAAAIETRGHALWALGLSAGRRGETEQGRAAFEAADSLFTLLGQRSESGSLRFMNADLLASTGADDGALREFGSALSLFGMDGGNMHQNLLSTIGPLVASRHPYAAVWYHQEALRIAEGQSNPQFRIEALIRLAQAEARVGDTPGVGQRLVEARRGIPGIPDSTMAQRVRAEYDEFVGMYLPGVPMAERDSLLTAAVAYFDTGQTRFKLPALLERRGYHRLQAGQDSAGRADLRSALALVEDQLADMTNPGQRATLVGARQDAVATLVESYLDQGDTVQALLALDRPRASASRRVVGFWDSTAVERLSLEATPGTAIVAYGVLGERVLAWVLADGRLSLATLPVGVSEVSDASERLRYALRTGASEEAVSGLTARLQSTLIDPLASKLDGVGTLVLVPDGPLHGLPFAVLGARPGDLLRRYRLVHSPSVAFALSGEAGEARPVQGATLAVSATEWDPERHPGLPPLRFADEEAAAVAELYGVDAVPGPESDEMVGALAEARVFHFAGHGVYRADRPDLSTLVLGGSGGGLPASRIAELDLSNLDLAVLAACDTQQGASGLEGGLAGLTWSFLDAGARGVIGSLWAIPDQATSRLMVDLHRQVAAGVHGAEALRVVQVAAADRGDAGWAWAAFRYEGHRVRSAAVLDE